MKKSGFTILELLVVISVLVILIGIAIPRFKGMQDAGKIAQAKSELKTMQTAVESYYMNQSPMAYPASSPTLGGSTLATTTPQIINSTPPYDPFGATTTTEYKYVFTTPYYVIGSVGTGTDLSTLGVNTVTGVVTKATGNLCVTNAVSGC
ncbi:MAG: prepilin-type N-terminal cleavage/methylation domain-containing protein [Candidatus Omnitrophica bacterium]|nr:prepilin-type N-terminal cleavage/methylation domain-containing protein [Candidatus Omnitrophota bacterium]